MRYGAPPMSSVPPRVVSAAASACSSTTRAVALTQPLVGVLAE
jgi:hypothetical protein